MAGELLDLSESKTIQTKSIAVALNKKRRIEELKVIQRAKRLRQQFVVDGIQLALVDEQATWMWKAFLECSKELLKLSEIEVEQCIKGTDFVAALTDVDRLLENLPKTIKRIVPGWKKTFLSNVDDVKGSPRLLIICQSAIRAVDLVRAVRVFSNKNHLVLKLFGKHMKVSDQCKLLDESDVRIAVGCPNRISKLIEAGSLKIDRLHHIIIDMAQDSKKFTIFDIKQVRDDFMNLFHSYLLKQLPSRGGCTKICLY